MLTPKMKFSLHVPICDIAGCRADATWYRLVPGDTLNVPSWMLEQKRPMGCQYMNTHCKAISEVFNCNTNIQIGDRSQVFYSTLYCGKSTQKDNAERTQRINVVICRRLLLIQQEVHSG